MYFISSIDWSNPSSVGNAAVAFIIIITMVFIVTVLLVMSFHVGYDERADLSVIIFIVAILVLGFTVIKQLSASTTWSAWISKDGLYAPAIAMLMILFAICGRIVRSRK